jgi:formylglycine-generating enzyme
LSQRTLSSAIMKQAMQTRRDNDRLEQPSFATEDRRSCCAPPLSQISKATEIKAQDVVVAPAKPSPNTMVSLPGGTFLMGTDYPHGFPADGEGPVRPVSLSAFAIDIYPVTNRDFAEFVAATRYRTEAEQFGWSFVFWMHIPEERFAAVVEDTVAQAPWWCKVAGASWDRPEGPGSSIEARMDHPVVHVSWNDAQAYARWTSKSLPTEAQWEHAARGGLEQKLFAWGDDLTPEGKHLSNVWQGRFPQEDTAEDGYSGTCPVDAFPPNGYGIYSITGNVWEWCADWSHLPSGRNLVHDPTGSQNGQAKVMKGGSFLCHASYCNRYRVAARTSNTPDSSASNIGFRCARNATARSG